MNTIEYHSRCVDSMDLLLKEVTDLSNLCFYQKFIQDSFQVRDYIKYLIPTTFMIAEPMMHDPSQHIELTIQNSYGAMTF